MSFAQGASTQPLSIAASNVFMYGSSTNGTAFAVQQLSGGNVFSAQTSTGSTGLIVNPSGLVGIGTAIPTRLLHLYAAAGANEYRLESTAVTIGMGINTGNNFGFIYNRTNTALVFGTNDLERMRVSESGNVGIGTNSPTSYTLQVVGTIGATGDITALYSDERLKTVTGALSGALDKVCSLTTFTYRNNELAKSFGFKDDYQRVGVSAQQVQKVLPEAVRPAPFDAENQSGQNYLTVQYEKLVPLLIEALKEERKAREELEKRIKNFEVMFDSK